MPNDLHIAIDGNEANVPNRVGSNVYAFELITALELLLQTKRCIVTVLLSSPPVTDLPKARKGWKYQVFGPRKFWTQWALPLHLLHHRDNYDVLLTPGHYAPRFSAVPYVSAVMDAAYLEHPEQFTTQDRAQLEHWTAYSVKRAQKVIAISEFTKKSVIKNYKLPPEKISVVYPAVQTVDEDLSPEDLEMFFATNHITKPYILFVGTLQPRKNVETIVEAFEQYSRKVASTNLKMKQRNGKSTATELPKLVLAGKVGWLADKIMKRIDDSPFKSRIILPGFVTDTQKKALYKYAMCTVLMGIHEGFGIPPLEAMKYGSIPVVANATSLPEVVGEAGYIVKPFDVTQLANTFMEINNLSRKEQAIQRKLGREQSQKFSWESSAEKTYSLLKAVGT
jgi:glycosyltransferase involved in cell wall biosynthesis